MNSERQPTRRESELNAHGELHDARIARQTGDDAGGRADDVGIRQPKVRTIEQVEDVPAYRRRRTAAKPDAPLHAHVERHPAWTAERVPSGVAERPRRHLLERGDVEPLLDRLRTI